MINQVILAIAGGAMGGLLTGLIFIIANNMARKRAIRETENMLHDLRASSQVADFKGRFN